MKKFALAIILLLALPLILAGCTKDGEVVDNSDENGQNYDDQSIFEGTILGNTQIEKLDSNKTCQGASGQKACPASGEEIAVLETNYGTIKIKLFQDKAPKTVENFKKLTKEKFYDGLTFHRIIPGFMIQGGDPDGTGSGGPGYTVEAEINSELSHIAGALATARQSDAVNPEKRSSGSQFYIVHDDTGAKMLDGEYTIFAQVIEGQNIVDAIASVQTGAMDKPEQDVIIEKVYLEKYN